MIKMASECCGKLIFHRSFLDKTKNEFDFIVQATHYFCSRLSLLHAEELKGAMAAQLLNDAERLLDKLKVDMVR